MASREDVQTKLGALHEDFAALVRHIDKGDSVAGSRQARQLLDAMRAYLDHLQTNFSRDFAENRLSSLEADRASLPGAEDKLPAREDLDRVNRVAVHIARNLRTLTRITNAIYPRGRFPWRVVARVYGPKVAAAAVIALVVGGVFAAYRSRETVRGGLTARYYSDMNLKTLYREVHDQKIDFPWGEGGPLDNWRRSEFSARWTGYLRVPTSDRIEIYTHNDDGVRVFLGGVKIIDDWARHGTHINRAELKLDAGYYPFKIEYFEHVKKAQLRLFWKLPSDKQPDIIPPSALVPEKKYLEKDFPLHESLSPDSLLATGVIGPDRVAAKVRAARAKKSSSKEDEKKRPAK